MDRERSRLARELAEVRASNETQINNLKKEECLRKDATILPSAARVWAMGVQVLTDTGVPLDMAPMERLLWSPAVREVDMDEVFYRRTLKPLTKPATALTFDLRAPSPLIKREERFELEMSVVADGRSPETDPGSGSCTRARPHC